MDYIVVLWRDVIEYEVLKQLVNIRNEMGLFQSDVARKSRLIQHMVSRIETAGNSPTLRSFIINTMSKVRVEYPEVKDLLMKNEELRREYKRLKPRYDVISSNYLDTCNPKHYPGRIGTLG